jgi:hypothetical protein
MSAVKIHCTLGAESLRALKQGMGDGRIFLNKHRASLFNEDLSNEPNFGWIHFAGKYL